MCEVRAAEYSRAVEYAVEYDRGAKFLLEVAMRQKWLERWLVGLVVGGLVLVAGCAARLAGRNEPACPRTQAGEVVVGLDGEGLGLQRVDLPCAWEVAPVVVVSPRGLNAEFAVERFFVDPFDGSFFVIGVRGDPGVGVTFGWVAVAP